MNKKIIKLMFAFGILGVAVALGAEGDAPAAAPDKNFWDLIVEGGPFMIPLALLSIATLFFIVQNFLSLRENVLLRPDLLPGFIQLMKDKKVLEAHTICKENETLFTYVFAAGLERCSKRGEINFGKVKEGIEEASTEEVSKFMRPIDYLSIIGATAPMLGLLGTVSGMIKAFQTIGTGGMGDPAKLAGNIGEALMTTATGLVIAIPAMLFYYYFRNNFIKSTATLARNIGALLDTFESGELPLGFETMGGEASAPEVPAADAE